MPMRSFMWVVLLVGITSGSVAQAEGYDYIAGTQPSHRPDQAPVLTEVQKNADWYQHALYGVESPYPHSLKFLEDQGNWFTPFNHPGMTHPYDLRGWHSK
ncbi:hypothetical protein [Thiofilum flexile]|uniref:hypothetical protein n=1 Tax=Thiofilum flexile TaxID=125627 RepID=UPI000368D720|nr:hypothetical protein [Thiofilum flexile]